MHRRTWVLVMIGLVSACGNDPSPAPLPQGHVQRGVKPAAPVTNKLAMWSQIEGRVTDVERAKIRHELVDRDFVVDDINRDPFAVPTSDTIARRNPTKACTGIAQFVTTSYTDLRLVGILAESTQRRASISDAANVSHDVRKGDCVGRERALVKDIGAGYITFELDDGPKVEERSIELYVRP